jgi:hypothetical protein
MFNTIIIIAALCAVARMFFGWKVFLFLKNIGLLFYQMGKREWDDWG